MDHLMAENITKILKTAKRGKSNQKNIVLGANQIPIFVNLEVSVFSLQIRAKRILLAMYNLLKMSKI